jgi:hypothetical protein
MTGSLPTRARHERRWMVTDPCLRRAAAAQAREVSWSGGRALHIAREDCGRHVPEPTLDPSVVAVEAPSVHQQPQRSTSA